MTQNRVIRDGRHGFTASILALDATFRPRNLDGADAVKDTVLCCYNVSRALSWFS